MDSTAITAAAKATLAGTMPFPDIVAQLVRAGCRGVRLCVAPTLGEHRGNAEAAYAPPPVATVANNKNERHNTMNTLKSILTQSPSCSPKKGITALFWVGIVLAVLGIMSIWAAETFMADNPEGQKGVLVFYRTFGPFTLAWVTIAACTHVYIRTRGNRNQAA